MPTVVSYMRSNAFRPKGAKLGEGEVYNTITNLLEEPENERLLGFQLCDTEGPGVIEIQRAIWLGRA